MTLHVLHAGDGYSYLTKQVASADRELEQGQGISDYYNAHGTPPGHWFGGGLDGLAELDATDSAPIRPGTSVSEEQMKALFGEGMHPNADAMIAAAIADGASDDAAIKSARLGRKFPKFDNDIELLREHAVTVQRFQVASGRRPNKTESNEIMETVGKRIFERDHNRKPTDRQELRSWIAAEKSKVRQPVAGYDLVFTPPKSVSVLWALGDDATRQQIERIHRESVTRTLRWIEKEACFTRTGKTSQETVDTTGLVATLYDHYDSRAGDPNLHTHAVVSIKVRTESDGKWRALDGSTLHRYGVAGSQRYNADVMSQLHTELGFGLTNRSTGRGRQDVIEVAEVPRELCEMFSSRRTEIEVRRDQLVAEYRAEHGKMPTPKAMFSLYQQANLDTREGKQQPETLRQMQAGWATRSAEILGAPEHVDSLAAQWQGIQTEHASGVRQPRNMRTPGPIEEEARQVITRLENARASWATTHVHSAVAAHLAGVSFNSEEARRQYAEAVTHQVVGGSVPMPKPELPTPPSALRRRDGEFILTTHGSALHTSHGVIAAEQSLLDATRVPTAYVAPQAGLHRIVEESAAETGRTLNAGQRALAEHFVGSGALLAVGIGPAGTGKTTAMKVVADTWKQQGQDVIALAPSAVAAEVLGDEIGVQGLTLATLTYPWRGLQENIGIPEKTLPGGVEIAAGTMLLVDEASLASTKDLAAVTEIAEHHGAIVRLLGDPAQLDAVESGGAFRMLAEDSRAPELTDVVRFGDDTQQAENSLALRKGESASLDMFFDRGWVHAGTGAEMKDLATRNYLADIEAGKSSIIMLATRDDVREVNLAIQAHYRAAGKVDTGGTLVLSDELECGVGDTVLTRRNARNLRAVGGRRRRPFVRNGDLWTVTTINADGSLTVRNNDHQGTVTLPANYVGRETELGYAATIHRSQGLTVHDGHTVPDPSTDRAGLYVATTRGGNENHLYVNTEPGVTLDTEGMHLSELDTPTERVILEKIVSRDNGHTAALTEIKRAAEHARSPERLREAYLAAHTRLQEHWLDTVLDRALPSAVLATIEAGDPKSRAELRDALAQINDSGNSATHVLTEAINDGELHTSRDIARVLRSRIETHSPIQLGDHAGDETTALPALPPRTTGTDKELDDYARTVAAKYTQARPEHAPQPGIGDTIRAYEATQKRLDQQRVNGPLAAVFDETTADRLAHARGARGIGRQLGKATLAGLDPHAVLERHAHQLRQQDQDITVMGLIRDMGPAIEQATTAANTAWLRDHDTVLREHFPIATALVDRTDDPRWTAAAGRMRELTDSGHYELSELCAKVKATTRNAATPPGILDALDTIAPTGQQPTNPNAPRWVSSPALDADHVDHALAAELRSQYTRIAGEHSEQVRTYAEGAGFENVPTSFTTEVGPRPDDAQLRQEWARTAAEVHAYRHTHEITDTTSVAGDRPHEHTQRDAFNNVHTSIETYREHVEQHHENQHHQQQHELERHHTIATQQQNIDQDRRGPRM